MVFFAVIFLVVFYNGFLHGHRLIDLDASIYLASKQLFETKITYLMYLYNKKRSFKCFVNSVRIEVRTLPSKNIALFN